MSVITMSSQVSASLGGDDEPARAFARLKEVLLGVDITDERHPRLDLIEAAGTALRLADTCDAPEIIARVQQVIGADLRPSLAELHDAALATWYTQRLVQAAKVGRATAAQASGFASTLQEAVALRTHMLRCAEHNLGAEAWALLDDIVGGRGHADLVTDLERLAEIYVEQRTLLAPDGNWYDAAHVQQACWLAARIRDVLYGAASTALVQAIEVQTRAFVCLRGYYDDVRATVSFAFRKQTSPIGEFGSLYAAGRAKTSRTAGKAA